MNTEKTFNDIDFFPLSLLADLASKYSIMPGTKHYFRKGHPSGLGGISVYFPRSLEKIPGIRCSSAISEAHNTKSEQDLQSHKTAVHPLLLCLATAYHHFQRTPLRWLQHARKFFHLSSGILLASATMFSNLC